MTDPWQPGIVHAALSHVGMRRANNQDAFAVSVAKSGERFHERGHLFVVADGMGAHAAGELASQIASERIPMHYFSCSHDDPELAITDAVHVANEAIFERGRSNPEFHNMGTTASTLLLVPGFAYVAHVGDSRVYRLREQKLEQLTFDHSLVWEMQASGQVHSDSPLGKSIPKNVITRSLGPSTDVVVDLEGPLTTRPGDRYLLCSDGLTGQVDDGELGVLMHCLPPELMVQVLVDLANLRGGPDNTTILVIEISDDTITAVPPELAARRRRRSGNTPSRALLFTMAFCWLGAIGFGLVAAMGNPKFTGSAVVAFILGAIAGAVWAIRFWRPRSRRGSASSLSVQTTGSRRSGSAPARSWAHGHGPYRQFDATPSLDVHDQLWSMIDELRQTSERKHWMLDWKEVDALQQRAEEAKTKKRLDA
ncbi:MAG: protein phosphatase 2C domain-containing protein, partial [Planctomycetota bacterium]